MTSQNQTQSGLFNNSAQLFANHALTPLRVIDGHVFHHKDGCIARCENNSDARAMLLEAGYRQEPNSLIFNAPSVPPKAAPQDKATPRPFTCDSTDGSIYENGILTGHYIPAPGQPGCFHRLVESANQVATMSVEHAAHIALEEAAKRIFAKDLHHVPDCACSGCELNQALAKLAAIRAKG